MRYLAMDLDRTLIPNGPSPDDGSLPQLKEILINEKISPLFVTARRAESVSSAIERYDLPEPTHLIGQVGTTIHTREKRSWILNTTWQNSIKIQTPHWNRDTLNALLASFPELEPQPPKDNNPFKISYFLRNLSRFETVVPQLKKALKKVSLGEAELIASKDFNAQLAYIDILPKGINKRSALDFLCQSLSISQEDILFAGDSENDLSIFLSPYKSIIVANAEKSLKSLIKKEKGCANHFEAMPLGKKNGNYASGIIMGLKRYKWI